MRELLTTDDFTILFNDNIMTGYIIDKEGNKINEGPVGASCIVEEEGKILGLKCAKGRGIILPGGKLEFNEDPADTALRELYEETGVIGYNAKFVLMQINHDGFIGFTYSAQSSKIKEGFKTPEGESVLTDWKTLFQSSFREDYKNVYESYS